MYKKYVLHFIILFAAAVLLSGCKVSSDEPVEPVTFGGPAALAPPHAGQRQAGRPPVPLPMMPLRAFPDQHLDQDAALHRVIILRPTTRPCVA